MAYEAVCGEEKLEHLEAGIDESDSPLGARFDRSMREDRFPLLAAKFGLR